MRIFIKILLAVGLATVISRMTMAAGESLAKGVGPIQEQKLDPLDTKLATSGKELFTNKCSACHKMGERYVGPALKDITKRRAPEWIMNMILNPLEMTQKDPAAQALLEEFLIQMTFQNVSTDESRAILEYFRYYDEKGELAAPTNPAGKGLKPKSGKEQTAKQTKSKK